MILSACSLLAFALGQLILSLQSQGELRNDSSQKGSRTQGRVAWTEGVLTKWGSRTGSPGALPRALPHLLSLTVGFAQSRALSGQAQYITVLPRDLGWDWSSAAVPLENVHTFTRVGPRGCGVTPG